MFFFPRAAEYQPVQRFVVLYVGPCFSVGRFYGLDESLNTHRRLGRGATASVDKGDSLTGEYSSETISNLHGGIKRGTRYAQQIRIGAQFDLSKLLDTPDAGVVQIIINDRRGHSATEDLLGNRLSAQENYGG